MFDLTKYDEKAELLKVLAHPVRLCIVKGLMEKECNVSYMQECLQLPQSTVSQHIGILRSRGIIKGSRNGLEIKYALANEDVKRLVQLLFQSEEEV